MAPKQLPAKTKGGAQVTGVQIRLIVLLTLLTAGLLCLGSMGLQCLAHGLYLSAALAGAVILSTLWLIGSVYITAPLSIYFLGQYYNERNFSAIDITHSRALKLLEKLPVRRSTDVAVTISNLALVRLSQGHIENAEQLFEQAAADCAKDKSLRSSLAAVVINHNLAVCNVHLKNYVQAELYAERASEILQTPKMQKWKGFIGPLTAAVANIRYHVAEYDAAYEKCTQSLEMLDTIKPPAISSKYSFEQARWHLYGLFAAVCMKQDKQAESEKWCDKALAMYEADPRLASTLALRGLNDLANQYMNAKLFDRAEKLLDLSYAIAHDHPFHPESKQVQNYYEKLLLLTGREDEVADMRAWLRHTLPPLLTTG